MFFSVTIMKYNKARHFSIDFQDIPTSEQLKASKPELSVGSTHDTKPKDFPGTLARENATFPGLVLETSVDTTYTPLELYDVWISQTEQLADGTYDTFNVTMIDCN